MSKTFKRMLAMLVFLMSFAVLVPITTSLADETATALYGTPELGSNDPLWEKTTEHKIDQSTLSEEDTGPEATGTVRILWDEDYLYTRVVVEDSDVYTGNGPDHQYDSVEFFVGPGDNGSNQWRVSATGVLSGQTAQGRAAWTELTDTGYIVEMRIPKRSLTLEEGPFTFEVNINNSTSAGGDRYEVVSSFGEPDTGFSGHASFEDSLTLIGADEVDERYSITATAGSGGGISPSAPGDVLRVEEGEDITFTFTPDRGMILDTVTVDDEEVSVTDNTYVLENIVADQTIHATFKNDSDAGILDFVVWNDNFAKGEYTTAVIIDLGEGNAVKDSDLTSDMFTVSARNTTLDGSAVTFEGTREISRVYANDEPSVRGYSGPIANSPDYQDGLESGRYIVVEFEFYNATGGVTTLDTNSNSTLQNYRIVQNEDIILTDDSSLENVVFEQKDVVNPILDKFTTGNYQSFNYARYLHTNENGEVVNGLPLYIYTHGNTRGGTNAETDQKAAMKSANGAVALMKKMEENPDKYASHVLNVSSSSGTPNTADVKVIIDEMIEDGLVDPNRIYLAGFSMGAGYTNNLINTYPGFFAAGAPMAAGDGPNAANEEAHADLGYWLFVNSYDYEFIVGGVESFIEENLPYMNNGRASIFDSNESFVWPYNQFDQADQRPPMEGYVGHEIEAAVLYNKVYETDNNWNMAPTAGTLDDRYQDVFDWMFAQSLLGEIVPGPDPEPEPEPSPDPEPEPDPEPNPEPADPEPADPEPTDPEPTDPEPTDPEPTDSEPTDPSSTDSTSSDSEPTDSDSSDKLPATATNYYTILLIGLTLLIAGTVFIFIKRKKVQNDT